MAPLRVVVVIPALDEERGLARMLPEIPSRGEGFVVEQVVVVDNGSRDRTAEVARNLGATVVLESRRGYGTACLAGIAKAAERPPDVLAFLDADGSDVPEDLHALLRPIVASDCDFVVGTRLAGTAEPGAVPVHVAMGNRLATWLIRLACGQRYGDLGPFRAIRWNALCRLRMRDPNFGWTVEMQVKAALEGLRIAEVPVRYRRRLGVSKISGTISGTIRAGSKILVSVFRYRFLR